MGSRIVFATGKRTCVPTSDASRGRLEVKVALNTEPRLRAFLNLPLSINVYLIKVVHSRGVLEYLGDLDSRRNELENVAVILQWPALMLSSVPHFQRILQDGDKLLNLSIVQDAGGDPPLCRQSLQQIHPFRPLAVVRAFNPSHILRQRDRKLIFSDKVKGTLREPVIDVAQDAILFLYV